jgi:lipopolysaccharide transport system ATP-binding protein
LGEVGTGTLSHDLNRFWFKIRGKEDPYIKIGDSNDRSKKGKSEYVWSLKDINFEIEQGDAVGIIGRNGAGKSTLLKLLSKVTKPTTGSFKVNGRIASLLEVGTGFNPEMTGRENIYLNGAILGMRRKEIDRKFDEIVDFSGVERYIDTPVKRYSSGMYVRLAFAVAAYLESEILIVDEVLAVGDAEFQKKCLGKMGDVSKGEGRTVLFVSHNMDAILRLCNSSILMQNGKIVTMGKTEDVVTKYLSQERFLSSSKIYDRTTGPGSEVVVLLSSEVIDADLRNKSNFLINEKIGIKIEFEVLLPTNDLVLGFNLYSQRDVHILSSHQKNRKPQYAAGIYKTVVWLPANFLSEGIHYCGVAAMSYSAIYTVHFHDINQFVFNVSDVQSAATARGENYTGEFPGIIRPILEWDDVINL